MPDSQVAESVSDAQNAGGLRPLLNYLRGKKILILGMGREGRSSLAFFRRHENYLRLPLLALADQNCIDPAVSQGLPCICGDDYLSCLGDFDLVMKAPGISLKRYERLPNDPYTLHLFPHTEISGQMDLLLRFPPMKKILAVSGTKGKSTTTTLLYEMMKRAFKHVYLRGNIGIPVFEGLESMEADACLCLELSSHQLEFCRRSPAASSLLNFYPEHLDHYKSYNEYIGAKINIMSHQEPGDFFLLNTLDADLFARCRPLVRGDFGLICNEESQFDPLLQLIHLDPRIRCRVVLFKEHFRLEFVEKGERFYEICPSALNRHLKGAHILFDCAVASAMAAMNGADVAAIRSALEAFKGLPHRCEWIGKFQGVDYYNDSISTIAETCRLALKTLGNVSCLLIGGKDRGIDQSGFAAELYRMEQLKLVCMPDTGRMFFDYFTKRGASERVRMVENVEEAVRVASQMAERGTSVLLSPAASSYNAYRNFEERGDRFREAVLKLMPVD